MAKKILPYSSTIYGRNHPQINQYFLEQILFPELKRQAKLGVSGAIKVTPDDYPDEEYVSIQEAKTLIIDYLTHLGNLPENQQKELQKTSSFEKFANLAWDFYYIETKIPQSAINPKLTKEYQDLQQSNTAPVVSQKRFNSDDRIRKYNELYNKVLTYQYLGNSQRILAQLFPPGTKEASDFNQIQLAQIIAANLSRLQGASEHGIRDDYKDHAVAVELSKIIARSYPKATSYLNYLGDDKTKKNVRHLVDNFTNFAHSEDPNLLTEYEQASVSAGQAIQEHSLNEKELSASLNAALDLIHNESERQIFITKLLRENNKRALEDRDLNEIIEQIAPDSHIQILSAIENQHLDIALQTITSNLYTLLHDQDYIRKAGLTASEYNLLKDKGINPFLVRDSLRKPQFLIGKNKASANEVILHTYNTEHKQQFKTIEEAYAYESQSDKPDTIFLLHARKQLNNSFYYSSLSNQERRQVSFAQFSNNVSELASRIRDVHNKVVDGVIDFEETITGKKWLHRQLDKWDVFAENFTVGKSKIPIFRLRSWIFDGIDVWKRNTTQTLLVKSSGWQSSFGKFIHLRIKDYQLGGHTLRGAVSIGAHRLWSGLAYKISAGIIKQGAIISTRTARRLLIKLGGKTLAKAGSEAILALVGIASGIGTILSIAAIADIVITIAKAVRDFAKKTLGNTGAIVTGITASVIGLFTGFAAFITSLFSLPVLVSVFAPLMMAIIISLSALGIYQFIINPNFEAVRRLDSGQQQINGALVGNGCIQATPGHGPIMQGSHTDPEEGSHSRIVAIDIYMPNGAPVFAAAPGRVVFTGFKDVYGNRIDIQSSFRGKNVTFIYGHLSSIAVRMGQSVAAGQTIGRADSTSSEPAYRNPHLHFEISGVSNYAECPIPGTNPSTLEGCMGIKECNASI